MARASAAARGGAISGMACADTRVLARCCLGIEFALFFRIGFCCVFSKRVHGAEVQLEVQAGMCKKARVGKHGKNQCEMRNT